MSNDVHAHEDVVERVPGAERRVDLRHAVGSLSAVSARIIGGSPVELVNFSSRGVLFECDSRLLIGARASVRITTTDANLIITGRVVRSRVKGLVNGALRYDAALVLDSELNLLPAMTTTTVAGAHADLPAPVDSAALVPQDDGVAFESDVDASFDPPPLDAYLAESEASLVDASFGDGGHDTAPAPAPLASAAYDVAAEELAALDAAVADAQPDAPADEEAIAFEADEVTFEAAADDAFDPVFDSVEPPAFDAVAVDVQTAADGVADADATAADAPFEAIDTAAAQAAIENALLATHVEPAVVADAQAPAAPEPDAVLVAEPDAPAVEFEAAVDFEGDVEFEGVPPAEAAAFDAPPFEAEPLAIDEPVTPIEPIECLPEEPASSLDRDDRVLLQFAATVPHDLAELRRIAADNQW